MAIFIIPYVNNKTQENHFQVEIVNRKLSD
jgi:hypothetical protein